MKADRLVIMLLLVFIGALIVVGTIIAAYAVYYISYPPECVGLINVDGVIATKSSGGGIFGTASIGSEDIVRQIEDAESRSDVKAVVFEVNSPGGSVVASKEIYEAVREMKKPKVAYFREVAASGGYYISAGTDYIVSEPDALTGSIGVIATFEDLSGLFSKLGINYTILKSGELKDMGTPSRPLTEKEKQIMQEIVSEIFQEFRGVVEEGRGSKLKRDKFEEILDARVMTGRQALAVGLVDQLGNRRDALQAAARLANITYTKEPAVCRIGGRNPFEELLSATWDGASSALGEFLSTRSLGGFRVSYT